MTTTVGRPISMSWLLMSRLFVSWLLVFWLLAVPVLACFSEAPITQGDSGDGSTAGTQADPTTGSGGPPSSSANVSVTADSNDESELGTAEATSDADSSTGDPVPADCEPALPGLMAWWRFDEDFSDAVGNIDPAPQRGAYLADDGRHAGGAGFDGIGGALVTEPIAPIVPDPSAFTIEAWVDVDDTVPPSDNAGSVADFSVVSQMASNAHVPNAAGWRLLMYTDTSWWFCLGNSNNGCNPDGDEPNVVRSGTITAPGSWIHLVAMRDGDELRLYVDGELRDAKPVVNPSIGVSAPLVIGATTGESSGLLDAHFFGRMDDVSVYDRALTQDEVVELALATMPRCAI